MTPYVTGELCERRDLAVTYTEVFVMEENSNLDCLLKLSENYKVNTRRTVIIST